MKAFVGLYNKLNRTNATGEKLEALIGFFLEAPAKEAVWGLALLSGRQTFRLASSRLLRLWATEQTELPEWLVDEAYQHVGDLAETISLLMAAHRPFSEEALASPDLTTLLEDLLHLRKADEPARKAYITGQWRRMDADHCFLFNKILTGAFRVGVSQGLLVRALSNYKNKPAAEVAHALMGHWNPAEYDLDDLLNRGAAHENALPYPFFLASPLESAPVPAIPMLSTPIPANPSATTPIQASQPAANPFQASLLESIPFQSSLLESTPVQATPLAPTPVQSSPLESTPVQSSPPATTPIQASPPAATPAHPDTAAATTAFTHSVTDLGDCSHWIAEWKWDGIRVQVIHRSESSLWSRGEERLDDAFPELLQMARALPAGTVIDGELLCGQFTEIRGFQDLQKRLGRKKPGPKIMTQFPVFVLAYDLLERDGSDVRQLPQLLRRQHLEEIISHAGHSLLHISPLIPFSTFPQLDELRRRARHFSAEGVMLKRKDAVYETGRRRGNWWKWKSDPMQLDAVLLYARKGHGRRSNLFTDYTLAIWNNDRTRLLPVANAYSGLSDAEIRAVDAWVKANTLEKFGPVRTVSPVLVFEIGFEAIQRSNRHKSGLALRFPRILRWRLDKTAAQADDLLTAEALLTQMP